MDSLESKRIIIATPKDDDKPILQNIQGHRPMTMKDVIDNKTKQKFYIKKIIKKLIWTDIFDSRQ